MSKLVAISLKEAQTAFSLRAELLVVRDACMLSEADIIVVTKKQTGEPELHLSAQEADKSAAEPCWWGSVVGLLLAEPGGDERTSRRLSGYGVDERFIRHVAARFRFAAAMVFILTPDIAFDMVLSGLEHCRARSEILTTALSRRDEEGLKLALRVP